LAAFAPGVLVVGKIVSAISSSKEISASEKVIETPAGLLVQPAKKALLPITVPPTMREIYCTASLLFIIKNILKFILRN
jgi:hypothetical protein